MLPSDLSENFIIGNKLQIDPNKGVIFNNMTRSEIISLNNKEMNYYELVARPRKIENVNFIKISRSQVDRIIEEIFRCVICKGILAEPVNIRTCLHKFCKKCIEEYNRKVKKECAVCRVAIETRRVLRDDYKITEIIKCIIPNIARYNEQEQDFIDANLPLMCYNKNKLPKPIPNDTSSVNDSVITKQGIPQKIIANKQYHKESGDLVKNTKGESKNVDYAYIGKKQIRTDEYVKSTYQIPKKKKLDIKSYYISKEEAKNEIIMKGNYINVKLINQYNSSTLTKLWMNDEVMLEEISTYIITKFNMDQVMIERIYFIINVDNKKIQLLEKSLQLKQIKNIYKMTSEDYCLYYDFNI